MAERTNKAKKPVPFFFLLLLLLLVTLITIALIMVLVLYIKSIKKTDSKQRVERAENLQNVKLTEEMATDTGSDDVGVVDDEKVDVENIEILNSGNEKDENNNTEDTDKKNDLDGPRLKIDEDMIVINDTPEKPVPHNSPKSIRKSQDITNTPEIIEDDSNKSDKDPQTPANKIDLNAPYVSMNHYEDFNSEVD